ncbi:unnamed protein product [Gadus morhua 'NCC']
MAAGGSIVSDDQLIVGPWTPVISSTSRPKCSSSRQRTVHIGCRGPRGTRDPCSTLASSFPPQPRLLSTLSTHPTNLLCTLAPDLRTSTIFCCHQHVTSGEEREARSLQCH